MPGVQVKCLRVLQYFPPPDNLAVLRGLTAVLRRVIAGSEPHKNVNKNNAQHAVVFEAIALALALEADAELLSASVALLARFISVREPNIKYLGLENLVRLAEVPAVADTIARCACAPAVAPACLRALSGPAFGIGLQYGAEQQGANPAGDWAAMPAFFCKSIAISQFVQVLACHDTGAGDSWSALVPLALHLKPALRTPRHPAPCSRAGTRRA